MYCPLHKGKTLDREGLCMGSEDTETFEPLILRHKVHIGPSSETLRPRNSQISSRGRLFQAGDSKTIVMQGYDSVMGRVGDGCTNLSGPAK